MGEVSSGRIMTCHCADCQKFSGAPFGAAAVITAENVKIFSTVTKFLKIAETGNERVQGFCGKCGSHLYAVYPAKTLFMNGTGCFDQHHELVPAKHSVSKSAVEWVGEIANLSRVAEGTSSAAVTPFIKA